MKELENGERQRGLHWVTAHGEQGRDGQAFKSGEFWGVITSCGFIDNQTELNCKYIAKSRGSSWKAQCSILWNIRRNSSMEGVVRHHKRLPREEVECPRKDWTWQYPGQQPLGCWFPQTASQTSAPERSWHPWLGFLTGATRRRPLLPTSAHSSRSFSSLKSQY